MNFNRPLIKEQNKEERQSRQISNKQFNLFPEFVSGNNEILETEQPEFNKLFSIITHNIRNPFGTLLGFSDMLELEFDELDDGEKRFFISEIRKSAKYIYNSVENFICWAALNNVDYQIDFEKFDIYEVALEVVQLNKKTAGSKNILINIEKKPDQFVLGNRNLITILIKNLLSNAIKNSPGNSQISIGFESAGNEIITSIKDEGVGIDREILPYLFSSEGIFKAIKENQQKGVGLGLILSKKIIDVHKGEIWVESEINKGSKFSFSLIKVEVLPEEK